MLSIKYQFIFFPMTTLLLSNNDPFRPSHLPPIAAFVGLALDFVKFR